ncbi:MAG: hypothetical protein HY657_02885 [Acidobacteria bacterium]|nr:hypothetical protein [Acidobacteriota bacterium]
MRARIVTCLIVVGILCGTSRMAFAQIPVDLSGEWANRMHEDLPWRGPGQRVGEFQGLPINAEARMKAESWMASAYAMPERQCIPFPMDMAYTFGNMRIWKVKDSPSQEVIAWGQLNEWQQQERTIWMDGRPHPPEGAPHTWQGFSTGEWDGTLLKVTTTHLKMAYLERNGVPRSDQATVVEYYARHDNILTITTIVEDPVYLTEPWVRTRNFASAPNQELNAYPCRPAVELDVPEHQVPHYLPGQNPFLESGVAIGVPKPALPGGAHTMYPEFARQLKTQP